MSSGSINVLHVDDEQDFTDLAAIYLQRANDRIGVESATSASEGLTALSQHDFDCIISDYDMPGQNGLEFLEAVRKTDSDLPFILFTGKGSEEVASEAIAAGVTDYLQKRSGTEQYELLANRLTNAVAQYRSSQQAANLERIRRMIRDVNQELVRAETREEIEHHLCQTISDAEPYRFAWIGKHDPDSQTITPTTSEGVEEGYLDTTQITTDEQPTGRGPTGKAIRTREISVVQDIPENITFEPWREDALERGYQSSAAIPIIHGDSLYGVLNVYADRTNAFDNEERDLLEELADDAAHALYRRESRERLETYGRLVENLPVGVYRTTPEPHGEVINVNPALVEILNADSPEALEGSSVRKFYRDPADRVALSDELQRTGLVVGKELKQETEDGEEIWISTTTIRTVENDEVFFDGIVQDITERKEHERELERQEFLFSRVQDIADIGVWEYDLRTEELTWSDGVRHILGINDEHELTFEGAVEFYHPDDREEIKCAVNEAIEQGTGHDRELRIVRPDGSVRDVHVNGEVHTDESGNTAVLRGVLQDITERKERETQLQRYEYAYDSALSGIAIADLDGEVTEVNSACLDMWGYDQTKDILGTAVTEVWKHPEKAAAVVDTIHETGSWVGDLQAVRDDGSTFHAQCAANHLTDDEGEPIGLLASFIDISERKEHERKLQRQNEQLDEFASVLSHDLRNPLNVARGRLELAEQSCTSEHFEPIERAHERMESLIEDLLTLAREGTVVTDREPVDLLALANDCWGTPAAADSTLVTDVDGTIQANETRLKQVVGNLFRNAIEHTDGAVTVTIGELEDGFYVADDGPGISKDKREKVFEAGYSTSTDGTGFGLNIVKTICEAHGWEIRVTEGSEGGARFEITGVDVVAE